MGCDLADMQLISKCNKIMPFSLCVIDIFSKYAWVIPLKGKKGITITNAFQLLMIPDGSNCKANKIWVDKGSEFCNRSMKSFLQNDNIEMYLTTMKKNLLLLKGLLESERTKFISI